MYGVVVGAVSAIVGLVLILCTGIDTLLSDNAAGARAVKQKRMILGVLALLAGILSMSAVLFGWPRVRGYLVPPP